MENGDGNNRIRLLLPASEYSLADIFSNVNRKSADFHIPADIFTKCLLTFHLQCAIMETKMKGFVSVMRNAIIEASIESLRQEGLRFSVDTLSDKLRISKKTVYKYFPDKEALALAIYEKYFLDAAEQAKKQIVRGTNDSKAELHKIYFDSKVMTRGGIFNKYKLNRSVYAFASEKSDSLWSLVSASFCAELSEAEKESLRIIVDGSFEKLCNTELSPDGVIERLVELL